MKLLPFTVLVFWGFLSQVFVGQNVPVVAGQKEEFGQRQPIPTPGVGVPATPMATFATPAPTAGISNQGRAAISSSIEFAGGRHAHWLRQRWLTRTPRYGAFLKLLRRLL